jgi:predicted transcriptional regulator with HTH domain
VKKHVTEKLKAYGYTIYYSLDHSNVRATVLLGVKWAGGKATIVEISENTRISYTNVKRAIFGHDNKYRKNMSLISTGSVTAENIAGSEVYIINRQL